jgi:hypothetical protein
MMKLKKIAFSILVALFSSISLSHATQTTLSNADLSVLIDDSNCKIQVTVADGGRVWTQPNLSGATCGSLSGDGTTATWTMRKTDYMSVASTVTAVVSGATLTVTISGDDEQEYTGSYPLYSWHYPERFLSGSGDKVFIPNGEGLIVPSNNLTAWPADSFYTFYTGFYMTIPMLGVYGPTGGYAFILEQGAHDCGFHMRSDGTYISPQINWVPEKGMTGYDRRVKYYFGGATFDYTTMASHFRAWVVSEGLFKTLAQKQAENSNVGKLLGAMQYYNTSNAYEDRDSARATTAGINNAIISPSDYTTNPGAQWSTTTADNVKARGHLVSSYHIYQDSWDPVTGPAEQCYHQGGYTPGTSTYSGYGYVKLDGFSAPSNASTRTFWLEGYSSAACGGAGYAVNRKFIYDSLASDTNNRMMRFMVAKILSEDKLDTIMIDTETANELLEDYDPAHSTTRRDDAYYRSLILQYHKDAGLVVGSESGQWWGIPYLDFLDGTWTLTGTPGYSSSPSTTTNSSTYQTAYTYRVPVFQLIYHDQVVSYNRWDGDKFEQFAATSLTEMNKKKLWFQLYGVMPLLRDTQLAIDYVDDVLPAAKEIYDVSLLVAGEQMTDHEFLESDYSVQKTTWSNGVTITVDFDTASVTVETPETVQRLIRGNGTVLRNFTFN